MKALIFAASAVLIVSSAVPSEAGVISRACLKADRSAASPELCGCIQGVANTSLTFSERRKASKFFDDPQLAQDLRQSDRRSDEKFWERYKAFGQRAAKLCG